MIGKPFKFSAVSPIIYLMLGESPGVARSAGFTDGYARGQVYDSGDSPWPPFHPRVSAAESP